VTAVLFLGVLPLPSRTLSEGVVWLPERAELRAGSDGFVEQVRVEPGTRVEPGAALVETVDPEERTRVRVLEAHLREIQARHNVERQKDRVKAGLLEEDTQQAQVELARARARTAEATLRAATTGRLVLPGAADLPGRFVHRGDLLGYVADLHAPMVRAVVTQDDILRVRSHTCGVEVRLANGRVVTGRILREVPTVDPQLPSLALGSMGGGRIALDARDDEGLTAAEPVYQLDVALPSDAPVSGIGARVRLRFRHPPEPLARRALRGLRGLFLGKLEA
jgi:putative peptide zinc metalloprotease protein